MTSRSRRLAMGTFVLGAMTLIAWLPSLAHAKLGPVGTFGVSALSDGEDDFARLERDQAQIFDRLTSLRTAMERLAGKLENEGREYKAQLLRKAITQIVDRDLEGRKQELLEALRNKDLQTVPKIEAFTSELEALYQLLLDQGDLDRLEQELARLRQAMADVNELRSEERELREETEQYSGSQTQRLEKLADELRETLGRQQELQQETERNAAESAESQARLKELAERLEQALEQQGETVDALRTQEQSRAGGARSLIEQAERATERGRPEELAEAARRIDEELARENPASAALEDALRSLRSALSQRAQASGEPRASEPDPAGAPERASDETESAERGGEESAESGSERKEAGEAEGDESGEGKPSESGERSGENTEGDPSGEESADRAASSESTARAAELQEALEAARAALDDAVRESAANARDELRENARRQAATAEETEALREQAEALARAAEASG